MLIAHIFLFTFSWIFLGTMSVVLVGLGDWLLEINSNNDDDLYLGCLLLGPIAFMMLSSALLIILLLIGFDKCIKRYNSY